LFIQSKQVKRGEVLKQPDVGCLILSIPGLTAPVFDFSAAKVL